MNPLDSQYIIKSRDVATLEHRIHDTPATLTIQEVSLRIRDFPFALIAVSPNIPNELLGYAGFVATGNNLLDIDSALLELRMLKVDPGYFGNDIGTVLLDYAKKLAREREKTLILNPDRPGQGMAKTYRDKEYPLTTEQLRAFYLRHGFREFTRPEVDDYAQRIDDRDLTAQLWFNGIDPQTCEFTARRRYSMSLEDAKQLGHIPFAEKLRLYANYLVSQYGHSQALVHNRAIQRRNIEEHLIEAR